MSLQTSDLPQRAHPAWIWLFFALLAGAFLLLNFSDRFVFFYQETYTKAALWSSLVLAPLVLYRMGRAQVFSDALAKKYPTAWLRNGILMPLMAWFVAGLACMAPLGWLFAAACWTGGATQHVHAQVVQVDAPAQRKGCDRHATLRFAAVEKKTCIDDWAHDVPLRAGQVLDVGIRALPFGFAIDSMAPAGLDSGASTNMP